MRIALNRQDNQALYLQIVENLRTQIEEGDLESGTRLPASRRLAKELGVNRITVVNAYAELMAEGLIESHVGRGTFVADFVGPDIPQPGSEPVSETDSDPQYNRPRGVWKPNRLVREMMRLARQPGLISFASGTVPNEFLPTLEFRKVFNEVLRRDGADALQYEDPVGYYPLRQAIVRYLNQQGMKARAEDILITDGCQQALDLVLRVIGRAGDAVLVESPSYLGLLDIINSHRMTPIGVPTDAQGIDVSKLEPLILRYRPQLIYLTPNFQNPTGTTMPLERRQALLDLARKYDLVILEDDIYRELYFEDPPPPSLAALAQDRANTVFYVSSFSKALIPGLRIGYLVAPLPARDRIITLKQATDISSSALNQRALNLYLENAQFEAHLRQVRLAYRERYEAMVEAIQTYLPEMVPCYQPKGGLYIWAVLPETGPKAQDLYLKAIEYGVAFAIGSVFFVTTPSDYSVRLNFVYQTPAEIQEGMRRLGKAWRYLYQDMSQTPSYQQPTMPIL